MYDAVLIENRRMPPLLCLRARPELLALGVVWGQRRLSFVLLTWLALQVLDSPRRLLVLWLWPLFLLDLWILIVLGKGAFNFFSDLVSMESLGIQNLWFHVLCFFDFFDKLVSPLDLQMSKLIRTREPIQCPRQPVLIDLFYFGCVAVWAFNRISVIHDADISSSIERMLVVFLSLRVKHVCSIFDFSPLILWFSFTLFQLVKNLFHYRWLPIRPRIVFFCDFNKLLDREFIKRFVEILAILNFLLI